MKQRFNSKTIFQLIAPLLIIFAVAAALPSSVALAQPVKIRFGHGVAPTVISPVLFQKKDLLKHWGKSYIAEFTHVRGTTPVITGLAAKAFDIGYSAYLSFPAAVTKANLDVKIIADVAQDAKTKFSILWAVLDSSGIRSVKDLKGKTVAVHAFGTVDHLVRWWLKKHGLEDKRDYNIVEVRIPHQEAMLREGKIHAAFFTSATLSRAKAKGGIRPLFSQRQMIGDSQTLFLIARTEFLQKNRAAVVDFLEDYVRALRWFIDPANRTEAVQITAKFLKRPIRALKFWVYGDWDYYRDPSAMPNVANLQRNLNFMHEIGVSKTKVEVSRYLDLSYLKVALARIDK